MERQKKYGVWRNVFIFRKIAIMLVIYGVEMHL